MLTIYTTEVFDRWFAALKDKQAARRIQVRIDRAEDRAAAMGADDDLAKYNKYLASLQRLDERPES